MFTKANNGRPQPSATSSGSRFAPLVSSFAPQLAQVENRTGLPDPLKIGLEQLSGLDLSTIRVHYNAPEPKHFRARAYTQGTNIYLAPGQERHLPHEGWHAVQQMQARVRPTAYLGRVPLNNDAGLEREAETMGASAAGASNTSRKIDVTQPRPNTSPTNQPLQRKPEDAIKELVDKSRTRVEEKYEIFKVARQKAPISLNSVVRTKGYANLILAIQEARSEEEVRPFVEKWNEGIDGKFFLDLGDFTTTKGTGVPKRSETAWYHRAISEKRITAPIKQLELLEALEEQKEEPTEEEELVVMTMFKHTAGYQPRNNQGKSLNTDTTYYRSTAASKDNPDNTKLAISNFIKRKAGQTLNVFNDGLLTLLLKWPVDSADQPSSKSGGQKQIFVSMDDIGGNGLITAYRQTPNLKIYSSGLPSNANIGERKRIRLCRRSQGGSDFINLGAKSDNIPLSNSMAIEDQACNAPHGNSMMIEDKSDNTLPSNAMIVRSEDLSNFRDDTLNHAAAIAESVRALTSSELQDVKIRAIQSKNHPSIILDFPDAGEKGKATADFIEEFNKTEIGNLKLYERNSFGFLYPAVSSVESSVRIWPGFTPPVILNNRIAETLRGIKRRKDSVAIVGESLSSAGHGTNVSQPPFHMKALETALHFARSASKREKKPKASQFLYNWIRTRLDNNEEKVKILKEQANDEKNTEHHFLKTAGVIENLMEYGYMLLALTSAEKCTDFYEQHLKNVLPNKQHAIFYLDNGMQAITLAIIIARSIIGRNAAIEDYFSYFEAPYVTTWLSGLGILAKKEDRGNPENGAIILADLNPVITPSKKDEYRENGLDTLLNKYGDSSIPILDITNSTLANAIDKLKGHERYMIVESMSKHYHVGTDKFTMGRLIVVGDPKIISAAKEHAQPVADKAYDPLLSEYRLIMDKLFYGRSAGKGGTGNPPACEEGTEGHEAKNSNIDHPNVYLGDLEDRIHPIVKKRGLLDALRLPG